MLPEDERGSPCRARLFAVSIGEQRAFPRDAVDVRRAVAHDAVAVCAHVVHADVVAPDDEDVGSLSAVSLRHGLLLFFPVEFFWPLCRRPNATPSFRGSFVAL